MPQRRALLASLTALALAAVAGPALAHHGWSEYDAGKTLTLEGTVKEVGFDNPHTVIRVETKEKTWLAVLAPPFRMEARGLPKGTLKPGMTVSVTGYPHRKDGSEMRAERILVGDKTIELR